MESEEIFYEVFEFVEFQVGAANFGISIGHVREIIQPVPVTVLPHAHPCVKGIVQIRGEVLPVIDMKKLTGSQEVTGRPVSDSKFLVAEFNGSTVVLDVTAVNQIQRIHFKEIEPVSDMYTGIQLPVSGVVKRKQGMTLLVDFERVMEEQFENDVVGN